MNESSPQRSSGGPRVAVDSLQGLAAGEIVVLPAGEAKHLTRSRRLDEGSAIEVFDPAGLAASAQLVQTGTNWAARLQHTPAPAVVSSAARLTICAAVPKGSRADWMAEKLAELGVGRWRPILAARSVVQPGQGKHQRWQRLVREAAKQSGAVPMHIEDPVPLSQALVEAGERVAVLTTERHAGPLVACEATALFIGPEGGWSEQELDAFAEAGAAFVTLGPTLLRVETAAICAAAIWSATSTPAGDIMSP